MLTRLFRRQSADILDERQLRQRLTQMETKRASERIDESTRLLLQVRESALPLSELLEMTIILHQNLRPTLEQSYMQLLVNTKENMDSTWDPLELLWAQFGKAYTQIIDSLLMGGRLGEDYAKKFRVIALFAIESFYNQARIRSIRYKTLDHSLWERVARWWIWVDRKQLLETQWLNEQSLTIRSVREGLVRLLLLAVSSTSNLKPTQIALAEKLCGLSWPHVELDPENPGIATYMIDLVNQAGPVRSYGLPDRLNDKLHFIATTGALPSLQHMYLSLKSGALPHGLVLPNGLEKSEALQTFLHLARHWGNQSVSRRYQRHRDKSLIRVVVGLDRFAKAHYVDDGNDLKGGTWIVRDFSAKGFFAEAAVENEPSLKVGEIVGVLFEHSEQWAVGVIRRLSRSEQFWQVGVQLLSLSVRALEILDEDSSAESILALEMGGHGMEKEGQLLVYAGKLVIRKPYRAVKNDQICHMQVTDLQEIHPGLHRAQVSMVQ